MLTVTTFRRNMEAAIVGRLSLWAQAFTRVVSCFCVPSLDLPSRLSPRLLSLRVLTSFGRTQFARGCVACADDVKATQPSLRLRGCNLRLPFF
eukprot:scaffold83123_cov31-Tisochrysis_lutea.AAC.4